MARVHFTDHLRRYFTDIREVDVPGRTVAEVVRALEQRFPGLAGYLVDDAGALRRHVNLFVGEEMVSDREHLSDTLTDKSEIFIIQALSGG